MSFLSLRLPCKLGATSGRSRRMFVFSRGGHTFQRPNRFCRLPWPLAMFAHQAVRKAGTRRYSFPRNQNLNLPCLQTLRLAAPNSGVSGMISTIQGERTDAQEYTTSHSSATRRTQSEPRMNKRSIINRLSCLKPFDISVFMENIILFAKKHLYIVGNT